MTSASKAARQRSTPPLRAVGYLRVSTEEQARDGVSLDAQRHRIEAHAEAQGWELAGIEADNGISGKRLNNRPGLRRALSALRKGRADALLVVALDRLSRTTTDVLDLAARSEREGWQIMAVQEQVDASSPEGEFLLTLKASLAQLERRKIGQRTKDALAELRRQGKRTSRFAPFGYRWADGRRVRVGAEQHILRRIMRYRTQGLGKRRIAKALNGAGCMNPRTQGAWTPSTLAAVLRSAARRQVGTAGAQSTEGQPYGDEPAQHADDESCCRHQSIALENEPE